MPGQRKRKRARGRGLRESELPPGHWEPLPSTQDQTELRAYVRRLHEEHTVTDPRLLRIDIFCGRLHHPTTHQISIYVPDDPAPATTASGAGRKQMQFGQHASISAS
ncbi:hypothetical protein AB0F11_03890 [Streptomyces sp. NPDC032472]|uniref:hypothetical protein n=1 Tax=Streptomyces sp. NPDC032472 TaxID=3155018 RepID=UPI0033DA1A85